MSGLQVRQGVGLDLAAAVCYHVALTCRRQPQRDVGAAGASRLFGRPSISEKFRRLRRLVELRRRLRNIPRPQIPTWLWVILTVMPFALYVVILFVVAQASGPKTTHHIVFWSGWSFLMGRWVIAAAMLSRKFHLDVWTIVFVTFYLEVATAVFLSPNIDLLFRVPLLGPRLDQIQLASWEILHANAWLRRLTWFGLVIFVGLPVTATGATGGTFFGRLLGLTRLSTALGVLVGSAVGCSTLGLAVAFMHQRAAHILEHPLVTATAFIFVVLFVLVMSRRLRGYG